MEGILRFISLCLVKCGGLNPTKIAVISVILKRLHKVHIIMINPCHEGDLLGIQINPKQIVNHWSKSATDSEPLGFQRPKLWRIFFGSIPSKTSLQECLKTKHIPLPIASNYSKTQHLKHYLFYLNISLCFFLKPTFHNLAATFLWSPNSSQDGAKISKASALVPPFSMKVGAGWMVDSKDSKN